MIDGISNPVLESISNMSRSRANMRHMGSYLATQYSRTHQNTTIHNISQQNTQQYAAIHSVFKKCRGEQYVFSTTYTAAGRPARVHCQPPLPAANCGSRKMQGGPRKLRHQPNRRNGLSIPFSGEVAFHCIRERPNRSNFAEIEGRVAKIATPVIDGPHFPGLPGGRERVFGGKSGFRSFQAT